MLKILAHDVVNDIAIIKTNFGFNTRYGLEVRNFFFLSDAMAEFQSAQIHAIACNGYDVETE